MKLLKGNATKQDINYLCGHPFWIEFGHHNSSCYFSSFDSWK